MAFNPTKYRFLPMAGQTRVGLQNLVFSAGTEDALPEILTAGYLDDFINLKIGEDERVLQDGDLIHMNYLVGQANASWIKLFLDYDRTLNTYTLRPGGYVASWVDVPAYSANWTSNAQIGYDFNGELRMRGTFTSNVGSNTDPMGLKPAGYDFTSSYAISIFRGGMPMAADFGTDPTIMGTTIVAEEGDVAFVPTIVLPS